MPTTLLSDEPTLCADYAKPLLNMFSKWENTTTIVTHGGSVFEYKGIFPKGIEAQNYYNLQGAGNGFEGHLNLRAITAISFQDKPHRGRDSYAFVFHGEENEVVFKVFLGRNSEGDIYQRQLSVFKKVRDTLKV